MSTSTMGASVMAVPSESSTNMTNSVNQKLKSGKISVTSVDKGDTVMVVWNEDHNNYVIYTEPSASLIMHFLHSLKNLCTILRTISQYRAILDLFYVEYCSKKDQIQTNPTYRCLATDVYCFLQDIKLGQNVKSQPIKDKEIINLSEKVQTQPKRLSPIALYRLFQLFREMDGLKKIRG